VKLVMSIAWALFELMKDNRAKWNIIE
jgi:hypothetical protein